MQSQTHGCEDMSWSDYSPKIQERIPWASFFPLNINFLDALPLLYNSSAPQLKSLLCLSQVVGF